ncbi:NlpC/P60 family protein [Kitasatospora sp. RB6PN24]|uniref:C40 family peptidase n=1 Tax=Kitasatospora humi TaxID=2893891 RepID=UPI001E2E4313|nr:C40 family peptidase [Kitasatospora humi]MCC9309949.1 NlpC/P60 family protein [Kitasatospora humi]
MNPLKALRKLGCLGVLFAILVPALVIVSEVEPADPSATSPVASVGGIAPRMMTAYVRAAGLMSTMVPGCKGMTWELVAGIAKVESDNAAGHAIADDGLITPSILGPRLDGSGAGGNTTPIFDTDGGKWDGDTQYDRAVGPTQFLPSTFAGYAARVRPDNPGSANPNNADDESLATALYLCGNGRDLTDQNQLRSAVYSYNASQAYVDEVLNWATQYTQLGAGAGTATGGPSLPVTGPVSDRVKTVISAAASQEGVAYSWGGGSETGPSYGICCSRGGQDGSKVLGFDCSGLMLYAFAQVGVHLPRVASEQASVGQRIPASAGVAALQPGDLVFFGNPDEGGIYHVGLYVGGGQMINAPKPGDHVRQNAVWDYDFAGGVRVIQ